MSTSTSTPMTRLPLSSILGYGAGDAANNLAFALSTQFLLVYYTDAAGITAAAAGTLMLVVRVFDAFTDIVAGRIVDASYSRRWGKFRPFLLFGSVPLLLLSIATFSIPQIGHTGMLIWAYLSYALLGFAYSLVNIPFGSLAGAMTPFPSERAKLSSARTVGGSVVGGLLGVFVTPLLVPGADLRALFTGLTIGFAVVGFALYLWAFFTTRERVERTVHNVDSKQSFRTLKGNKALLMLAGSTLLFLTGMLAQTTGAIYYYRDVMHALNIYPIIAMLQLLLGFVVAGFVPAIVRRFGKRSAYIGATSLFVVGSVIQTFAPSGLVAVAVVGSALGTLGIVLVNILVWALEADTVEYGEWKTGVRTEGITYALFSFTRKAGQAIGGAVAAYGLAVGGYVAGAATQSGAAEWGIRVAVGIVPAISGALAIAIMVFYPLTDKRHAQIVVEIAERNAAARGMGEPSLDRSGA